MKKIIILLCITIFVITVNSVNAMSDCSGELYNPIENNTINVQLNSDAYENKLSIDENNNADYILEKTTDDSNDNISISSNEHLSSNDGIGINHVAKYTIIFKSDSISNSTTVTLNELESTKSGVELNKDGFTIKYSNSYNKNVYKVYYSGFNGEFSENFTDNLDKEYSREENKPSYYYFYTTHFTIRCDLNYYTVNFDGFSGQYSFSEFQRFIKGKDNHLHKNTGKYKITKEAKYKSKWIKKWFKIGKIVLKKKVKYVNGLKIVKKNNIKYLTIGKVKKKYTKVVKFVNNYKKVDKKLQKKGWEFGAYILKKISYRNGKTTIKYYYKYKKEKEIFKGYKYHKNPYMMTLEQGVNNKKIVSIGYFNHANMMHKTVAKGTFYC